MALKMASCTIAAIGLMLSPAALANVDCLGGFMTLLSSGCAPANGEDVDVARTCSEDCQSAFGTWPAECNEQLVPGQGIGDDMTYGDGLEQLQMLCEPCTKGYMMIMTGDCVPSDGGELDVAITCSEECESAFNNALPAGCSEKQLPDFIGQNMTYGQSLEQIQSYCDPCIQGFMQLSAECNDEGNVCMPTCTDLLSQTTADCADSNIAQPVGDSMMSIRDMLSAFAMQGATFCSPSPAPAPTLVSANCVKISSALAERWSAKNCSGNTTRTTGSE